MRILCVGGAQYKHVAARFYNVMPKLVHGFIRAGHCVQYFSDSDVARMSTPFLTKSRGIKGCNKKFIKFVSDFLPDLIVMNHADVISPQTLEQIQAQFPHIKMAQVNVDSLFNPLNVDAIRQKSGIVDANFITTAGAALSKIKCNNKPAYYIPNPVDNSMEDGKAFENINPEYELFFAAGDTSIESDRGIDVTKINTLVPGIKFKLCIASEGTGLFGYKYVEALKNSMMGLNLSRFTQRTVKGNVHHDDYYLYSSDRIAHYIGNGLLTFCDRAFSQHELFGEDGIVSYSSNDELIEKIKYYKEHPEEARKIAKRGWEVYHQHMNSTKVAQFIIDKVFNNTECQYHWPER